MQDGANHGPSTAIGKIYKKFKYDLSNQKTIKKLILIGFIWLRRLGSNQRPID